LLDSLRHPTAFKKLSDSDPPLRNIEEP